MKLPVSDKSRHTLPNSDAKRMPIFVTGSPFDIEGRSLPVSDMSEPDGPDEQEGRNDGGTPILRDHHKHAADRHN